MHPVSQQFLDNFVAGAMTPEAFLRFISLPNSDYIALGSCFVSVFMGLGPAV